MNRFKEFISFLTTAALVVFSVLNFNGCTSDSPLSSQNDETASVVQSNQGQISILRVDPGKVMVEPALQAVPQLGLFKYTEVSQYHVEEFVEFDHDKTLKVGDGETGESKIEFKKFNLPNNFNVVFEWAEDDSTYSGFVDNLQNAGEDIAFNDSVKTTLSYKMANLMDVDVSTIAPYAFNQNTTTWEKINTALVLDDDELTTYISSFGKLALFHIQNGEPVMLKKVQDTDNYARRFIEATGHGKLEVEGEGLGKSFVDINDDDLPNDMTVTFEWAAGDKFEGLLNSIEYGSNVTFNNPVAVRLSYENAKLIDVNEDSIGVYLYNDNNGEWEKMAGVVNQADREVDAFIIGFGRIALFYAQDGVLFDIVKLGENVFYMKKHIQHHKGGGLKVGNKYSGTSTIKFKKHDLPEDTTIKFEWAAAGSLDGLLNNMEFGPHGSQFNSPVEVILSYKMADLTGVDEGTLQVYYFNEDTAIWEFIGGEIDIDKKKIRVFLHHFSRYAVAWAR